MGFLLIPFPGGIGPREVALIAVLSPVMPRGSALAVALASRVVLTVGDLAWAGLAVVIGRRGTRPPGAAAAGIHENAGDRGNRGAGRDHPPGGRDRPYRLIGARPYQAYRAIGSRPGGSRPGGSRSGWAARLSRASR